MAPTGDRRLARKLGEERSQDLFACHNLFNLWRTVLAEATKQRGHLLWRVRNHSSIGVAPEKALLIAQ